VITTCPREQDVLDAIAANRWPRRCEIELREHIDACAICADLIEVVRPLVDENDQALSDVRVPPAGVVWWRAQIRARTEAARAMAQPITIAQGAALATVVAVAIALVMTGWARLDGWREALVSFAVSVRSIEFTLPAFVTQHGVLLMLVLGTLLIAAPVAVYLAFSDE
jgi:hypothetical protein